VLVKDNIRTFLKEINQELGTTILLTTHDISDIEALCSRVIMLDKGKIIYDGSLTQLKKVWGGRKKVLLETEREIAITDFKSRTVDLPVTWESTGKRQYVAYLEQGEVAVSDLLARVVQDIPILEMQIEEASTEEIVRKIYQEGIPDA